MDILDATAALPDDATHVANDDDVVARAGDWPRDATLALQFPKWTDGRAYSQAVLLRRRLGHVGRLVAVGDVVVDMLPLLARCGFDAARLRAGQNAQHARRAFDFVTVRYQRDPATPAALPSPR